MEESCPDLATLYDLRQGALPPDDAAQVRGHVGRCATCRAALDDLAEDEAFEATLRDAESAAPRSAAAAPPELPGYEVGPELSRGGQGVVFAGVERATGRPVAIKLLHMGAYATPEARRRFEREAETAAGLRHPGIVTLYAAGTADDGTPFLVMERVDGVPLDAWIAERRPDRATLLRVFAELCEAVAHAHRRGVVHRDLKPDNVLVDAEGRPRVLDFGLAKDVVRATDDVLATRDGRFLGTVAFAAPEQLRGETAAVDVRSDVYALGVTLYRLLVDEHPYALDGGLAAVVKRATEGRVKPPSAVRRGVPRDLDAVCLTAMAADPARRYASADALGEDVRRHLAGRAVTARADDAWYVLRRFLARHRVVAGVAVAAVAALACTAWWALRGWSQADEAYARSAATERVARDALAIFRDLVAPAGPTRLGPHATLLEWLRAGAAAVDATPRTPEAEAFAKVALAETALALGENDLAIPMLRRAEEVYGSHGPGEFRLELLRARRMRLAAEVAASPGEPDRKLVDGLRTTYDELVRIAGPRSLDALHCGGSYAVALQNVGRAEEAADFVGPLADAATDAPPAVRRRLLLLRPGLLRLARRFDEARRAADRALAAETDGGRGLEQFRALLSLEKAMIAADEGRPAEGVADAAAAATTLATALPSDHPQVNRSRLTWARALIAAGRDADAEAPLRDFLASHARRPWPHAEDVAFAQDRVEDG